MSRRWIEFFEDDANRLSMTRLMLFGSFFPASIVVCYIRTAESLGVYLAAYAGLAANNKWVENRKKNNVIPISRSSKKPSID